MDENTVIKLFINGIKKEMTKNERPKGIHISSAVYECPRLLKYQLEYGESDIYANADNIDDIEDGFWRMWIGTKLHETPLTDKHEHPLHWQYGGYDIYGTIDEIYTDENNEIWIFDKKFVAKLPNAMYEHHMNQVMFYSALIREIENITPAGVGVIYFVPMLNSNDTKRVVIFTKKITSIDIDLYLNKLKRIIDGVSKDEAVSSWYCKYCKFREMCFEGAKK